MVSLILCFSGFPSIYQYLPSYTEFSFTCTPPSFECQLRLKPWSSIPPCDYAVGETLVIQVSLNPDGLQDPYNFPSHIIPFGYATITCIHSSPQEADAQMEVKSTRDLLWVVFVDEKGGKTKAGREGFQTMMQA